MEKIVSFVGAFLKHVVGILILCWRRMLRAGLIAFAIGVVLALLVAVISTGQAFPGALALVVALLFGAALAYGVAMTVFIEEFFLGVVDLIRLLEGDARAVAHITATMAEREIGDVGHGLRRLIGLPAPTQPTTLAPTLPALPRYPAPASATTAPSTAPSTAPRAASLARDAAVAGAATVVGAAIATRASEPASQSAAAPQDAQATALGQPVRADQLPRIGWTLEHEAVRPARIASLPDTLAELAGGAALLGAQHLFGRREAPAAAPEPQPQAQLEPAPEARPADAEPLDVTVVSALPLPAPSPAPDSAPLEDERLAEPVALTLPEDEQTPAANAAPEDAPTQAPRFDAIMLAPAPATTPLRPEEHPAAEPSLDPLDPAMLAPAAPTTPLAPEEREDRQDTPFDPAMLTPAASTTPLAPEPPTLDPAMLAPAPSTTPLAPEERRAAWMDEPPLDPAMLTPAPATTPIAPEPEPAPVAAEPALAQQPASAPEQPQAQAVAEQPAAPVEEPPARTAFARITRPVAELGATLDAISRTSAHSAPRASAPESGLWERLSQALIDRSGAPSSPFAAPQSRPPAPSEGADDEEAQQG